MKMAVLIPKNFRTSRFLNFTISYSDDVDNVDVNNNREEEGGRREERKEWQFKSYQMMGTVIIHVYLLARGMRDEG